jgi:hypothetical protein
MNRPSEEFTELRALLDALCEESITADQLRRLEELLLTDPQAEAYYVQYLSFFADLGRHVAGRPVAAERSVRHRAGDEAADVTPAQPAPVATADRPTRSARRSRRGLWGTFGLCALAAGLLIAITTWQQRPNVVNVSPADAEPTDNTVAVLLQAPGAVWEKSDLPTRVGAPLHPGWLHLKSGLAQVEFYSGATVFLKGPADILLISRMGAYCARGKLRATVPPQAQGFTVSSPTVDLVDRGTEFGLQVGAGDKTEVHVFQGKVELYDSERAGEAAPHTELTTGQSVRVDAGGAPQPIRSDPAAFPNAQELAARSQEVTRLRQQEWEKASAAWARDPSLVLYYTFQSEQPWSRVLTDQAGGRAQPHDGVMVGCTWAAGRWPGRKGLEFKQVSDRVRLNVPGQFDALTLAAWVRVDALPNRFNSLMMTDGWDEGAPHWHVGQAGQAVQNGQGGQGGKIELGVQGPNKKNGAHYETPDVFTPERLGEWVHLAVVYDRAARRVTHYVDGQLVQQEDLKHDMPLHVGDVEIGNWNAASFRGKYPVRYFSGCMDEFMLFARALGDPEIEQIYAQGRPPF